MSGQRMRVLGAIAGLVIAGCAGPGASNSNSGDSGSGNSGNSSQSNSGNSGSGNSGSGDSSQSRSGSSGDSSQSSKASSGSSDNSTQSSEASAQASKESSESSGTSRSSQGSYSPVLSATLGGATAVGLGFAIWQLAKTPTYAIPPPEAVGQAAQTYLHGRTHQLREDLALGAGPSIEDLAAMARIRRDHLRLFGQLLREHRVELLGLAETSRLTPERALAWMNRVGQLARADARLDADRRAFAAAHGLVE